MSVGCGGPMLMLANLYRLLIKQSNKHSFPEEIEGRESVKSCQKITDC